MCPATGRAFRVCVRARGARAPGAAASNFFQRSKRARHARGDLRIQRVERDHLVGEEGVAAAVGGMEAHVIAVAERADQRVAPCSGCVIENAGMLQSGASLRASVPGRRDIACTRSHLSTTSGSSFQRA